MVLIRTKKLLEAINLTVPSQERYNRQNYSRVFNRYYVIERGNLKYARVLIYSILQEKIRENPFQKIFDGKLLASSAFAK